MKLNPEIISVLKNFSAINNGIRFKAGNVLDTISQADNIIASAEISETVPTTFYIYDLNEFLSIISLFKNPQLVFEGDKFVKVTEEGSRSSVKYFFATPETIKTFDSVLEMPSTEVTFTLEYSQLNSLLKAASVLQSPEILVKGEAGELELIALDSKDKTGNTFSIRIGEYDAEDCEFYFSAENLKLLPKDYEVQISSSKISNFKSTDGKNSYFISVEENSKYG